MSTPACPLCDPALGPVLDTSDHWTLILNRNQDLLGKCFLVLRRHAELVPELTSAEWLDLHEQIARATRALAGAFGPAHFNYAFLQNQDRHVHLHVIPRYDSPREFAGLDFSDPAFPGHYAVGGQARRLPQQQFDALAEALREQLGHHPA